MAKQESAIQAITVSVDYSDYLVETLPYLVKAVDQVIVVTTPSDDRTIDVALSFGAKVHQTEAFYYKDAPFNKGRAINEALKTVTSDWVLHVDSDISIMEPIITDNLDPNYLYHALRADVVGKQEWEAAKQGTKFPVKDKRGLGYFQLWNRVVYQRPYPTGFPTAAKSDTYFNSKWPRNRRKVLDLTIYHLTMPQKNRCNWKGRVSEEFA